MVKLKFIIKDNSFVLKISEGKERYYKSVKHQQNNTPTNHYLLVITDHMTNIIQTG